MKAVEDVLGIEYERSGEVIKNVMGLYEEKENNVEVFEEIMKTYDEEKELMLASYVLGILSGIDITLNEQQCGSSQDGQRQQA